jgi:hypothetical protein
MKFPSVMQSHIFKPAKCQYYFPHTTWHVPEDSEGILLVIPACQLHQQANKQQRVLAVLRNSYKTGDD